MSRDTKKLLYSKDHEWIDVQEDGTAYVGITDFAQSELGEIVYVEVDTVGEMVERHKVFGTVEAVKTTSELFMPVSGDVLEFNPKLDESIGDSPEIINDDPYNEGWIVKIKLYDEEQINDLLSSYQYEEMLGAE